MQLANTEDSWVTTETWVTYHGKNRPELKGRAYPVVAANDNFAGFDAGIYGVQWCSKDKLYIVEPGPDATNTLAKDFGMTDLEETFAQAAGGHREMLVNEIARIKARLVELENALKVIDSL